MSKPAKQPKRRAIEAAAGPPAAGSPDAGGEAGPIGLGGLEQHLGYLIRRAQLSIFRNFIATLAPANIRPAQYSVLVVIGANPGLAQTTLADTLNIERARLVRLLDELEARGLVERTPSSSDRRSNRLHLTRQGTLFLGQLNVLAAEAERNLAEKLGPAKRQQLLELLAIFATD